MNKVIIIIIIIKPRIYWWYPGWRPNMVKVKEVLCILSFWFDDFQKRSLPLHGDWIITRVHIIFVVECLCKIWTFKWKDNIVARNTQYSVIFMENNKQTLVNIANYKHPGYVYWYWNIFSHCSQPIVVSRLDDLSYFSLSHISIFRSSCIVVECFITVNNEVWFSTRTNFYFKLYKQYV